VHAELDREPIAASRAVAGKANWPADTVFLLVVEETGQVREKVALHWVDEGQGIIRRGVAGRGGSQDVVGGPGVWSHDEVEGEVVVAAG
jgi:hypothetical protein